MIRGRFVQSRIEGAAKRFNDLSFAVDDDYVRVVRPPKSDDRFPGFFILKGGEKARAILGFGPVPDEAQDNGTDNRGNLGEHGDAIASEPRLGPEIPLEAIRPGLYPVAGLPCKSDDEDCRVGCRIRQGKGLAI
jgi:hypothetical protein